MRLVQRPRDPRKVSGMSGVRASDRKLVGKGYHGGWEWRGKSRRGRRSREQEAMFYGLPAESVFDRTWEPPPDHETLPHGRVVTIVRNGRPVAERLV